MPDDLLISLDQALADQQDLESLCARREIHTSEVFPGNDLYGMATILKRYADAPPDLSLKFLVPHGQYLSRTHLNETERTALVPAVYAYPDYRLEIYRASTTKVVVPGASPFVYLPELMEFDPTVSTGREGTLFFPAHSTANMEIAQDLAGLVRELRGLGSSYQPVRVCIYWADFERGFHIPFVRAGFEVVSAGNYADVAFLPRLLRLLSMHRYTASNAYGGHLFYSVAAGCKFLYLPGYPLTITSDPMGDALERRSELPFQPYQVLESLVEPKGHEDPQVGAMSDYYLSAHRAVSPEQLRELIDATEVLDRGGRTFEWGEVRIDMGCRVPYRVRRPVILRVRRLKDLASRAAKRLSRALGHH